MRRLALGVLVAVSAIASVACGSSGNGSAGGRVHTIDGTVTVTVASPTAWLAALPSAGRTALTHGRPQRPCPPPPGALASVVDGASIEVHDGGGARVAVAPLAGSELTLADGHATCTLTFTVHLPTDDQFTVIVGSVPPVTVDGKKLRHDGAPLDIPLSG